MPSPKGTATNSSFSVFISARLVTDTSSISTWQKAATDREQLTEIGKVVLIYFF